MAQDFATAFYNSRVWKKCRSAYIAERMIVDGGLCEECHTNLGYIVHHKTTLTENNINNPNISLNHDELKFVCKKCHDEYEGHGVGKQGVKALFAFDENGQPISLRDVDVNHSPRLKFTGIGGEDRERKID